MNDEFTLKRRMFDGKIERLVKYENLVNIEKRIIRKGVSLIQKETKKNIRSRLPAARNQSIYYDDTMIEGARYSVIEDGQEIVGKAHIMGTRRSTSGTYRLRFFEGGTQERIQKRTGRSTGKIDGLNFFADARNAKEWVGCLFRRFLTDEAIPILL